MVHHEVTQGDMVHYEATKGDMVDHETTQADMAHTEAGNHNANWAGEVDLCCWDHTGTIREAVGLEMVYSETDKI